MSENHDREPGEAASSASPPGVEDAWDDARGGRRLSRRNVVTLGAIVAIPLLFYVVSVAVNLSIPCGPSFATGLVESSLVQIATGSGPDNLTPTGTGFAVSNEGHILTSRQVVIDPATGLPQPRILVRLPSGLVVGARLVGIDKSLDLAMVKVEGVDEPSPLPWGDLSSSVVGQPLIAAGFQPAGNGRFAASPTYTYGAITGPASLQGAGYVEHGAAISPMMRGGPLVTMCGQVVGVSTEAGSPAVASSVAEAKVREWMSQP